MQKRLNLCYLMKLSLLNLLSIVVIASKEKNVQFIKFGDHEFYFEVEDIADFNTAQNEICGKTHSHLLVISDRDMDEFVYNTLKRLKISKHRKY